MKEFIRLLILLLLSFFANIGHAQNIKKEDFFIIDSFAQKAGAFSGNSLEYIVDSITAHCTNELQMTRAFYCWEASFIAFDIKRHKNSKSELDNASTALMERKASSEGFAQMFKAMCDLKHIDCKVVKGVVRRTVNDIGAFNPDAIHYWNIVQINNTYFTIDVSMGAGELDEKERHFFKKYTDAYWLCNRKLFALSHFPDDKEMQLLEIPLTRVEFSEAPIVGPMAIITGITPTRAVKGIIRGIVDSSTVYKFNIAGRLQYVPSVQVSYDKGNRIDVPFDFDEFGFYITIPHSMAGEHSVEVYLGNSLAFVFKADIRKGSKKTKT